MNKIVVLLISLILFGCSNKREQWHQLENIGNYPKHYQKIVENYLSVLLEEPESVIYERITAPTIQSLGTGYNPTVTIYGYLVCVTYNAKNSYGAYAGNKTDGLLIKNNKIIQYIESGKWGSIQVCNQSKLEQLFQI